MGDPRINQATARLAVATDAATRVRATRYWGAITLFDPRPDRVDAFVGAGAAARRVSAVWDDSAGVLTAWCDCDRTEDEAGVCEHAWAAVAHGLARGRLIGAVTAPRARLTMHPSAMDGRPVVAEDEAEAPPEDDSEDVSEEASDDEAEREAEADAEDDAESAEAATAPAVPSAEPMSASLSRLDDAARAAADPSAGFGPARPAAPSGVAYGLYAPSSFAPAPVNVAALSAGAGKPGSESRAMPWEGDEAALAALEDPEDRFLIGVLAALNVERPRAEGLLAQAQLPPAVAEWLLPRLAATGRLYPVHAGYFERTPIRVDDGPTYQWRVVAGPGDEGWQAELVIEREGVRRPLDDVAGISAGGLLLADDAIARIAPRGDHPLLRAFASRRPLVFPTREAPRAVALLVRFGPDAPVELPADAAFTFVRDEPQLVLSVRPKTVAEEPPPGRRLPDEYVAEARFRYGDRLVSESEPETQFVDADRRRVTVRRRDIEAAAAAALERAGFPRVAADDWQRPRLPRDARTVPVAAFPPALLKASRAGWQVALQGVAYKQPGRLELSATTKPDWFDLEGGVDYEGERVALPKLLEALRARSASVALADGSFGILPADALGKLAGLLGLGETSAGRVRFRSSQIAVLDALLEAAPRSEGDAGVEAARRKLQEFSGIQAVDAPAAFRGDLRPYQREGLGWLRALGELGFGGCLADDMGLGKTVQILALLAGRPRGKPSLVVAPRSLVFNWKAEAGRFAPDLKVLDMTALGRSRSARALDGHDLVLTTYGLLRRDAAGLKDVSFDVVVLDEAQSIKNAGTAAAKAARLLKGDLRFALSGTPVENRLGDLWSIFEFLNPGMLGASAAFERFAAEKDEASLGVLARAVRPFLLRRTKSQVVKELPEKTEQTTWVELEGEQKTLYDELRDHYRAKLLAMDDARLGREKIVVLEALLRLRQAACHPAMIDPRRKDAASAKLDVLVPQLADVAAEGHKALVFSQFTSFLDLAEPRLREAGLGFARLDGRTRDREEQVTKFKTDPACPVFLASLKAGGLGLNLTEAEYVFVLDPWWNPAAEAQAVDRAHRIGQMNRVFAYRLVAKGTVEERVVELQQKKRALADAIVRAEEGLVRSLTREDLKLLLT